MTQDQSPRTPVHGIIVRVTLLRLSRFCQGLHQGRTDPVGHAEMQPGPKGRDLHGPRAGVQRPTRCPL
jgi:hypothetical protein